MTEIVTNKTDGFVEGVQKEEAALPQRSCYDCEAVLDPSWTWMICEECKLKHYEKPLLCWLCDRSRICTPTTIAGIDICADCVAEESGGASDQSRSYLSLL